MDVFEVEEILSLNVPHNFLILSPMDDIKVIHFNRVLCSKQKSSCTKIVFYRHHTHPLTRVPLAALATEISMNSLPIPAEDLSEDYLNRFFKSRNATYSA